MKIIQNKEYKFETNLSGEEVISRINKIIEKNVRISIFEHFLKTHFSFIENNIFFIKNTYFSPNIFGKIIFEENKTVVIIKMKWNIISIVFFIFWLLIASLYFIIGIYFTITAKSNIALIIETILFVTFISVVVVLSGFLLINSIFNIEEKKLKEYLTKILEVIEQSWDK
jgi:hypothetical protein